MLFGIKPCRFTQCGFFPVFFAHFIKRKVIQLGKREENKASRSISAVYPYKFITITFFFYCFFYAIRTALEKITSAGVKNRLKSCCCNFRAFPFDMGNFSCRGKTFIAAAAVRNARKPDDGCRKAHKFANS